MNLRYERFRWQTFGVTWIVYAAFYLTRTAWSAAKVALPADPRLTLSREDYGIVDSAQLGAYMAGQFIFGPLGDRFGPRKVLLTGMAVSVGAAALTGFSTTLVAFVTLALLQGLAQSTGWSNTTKTISNWFSLHERGRVFGWWCSNYAVGAAAAAAFAGWMMNVYARPATTSDAAAAPYWPAAFWGGAAVLAIVAVLAWVLLHNKPEDVSLSPIEVYHGEPLEQVIDDIGEPVAEQTSWEIVGAVLRSPSIWLLGVAYSSIKFTRYALILWGPVYVSDMAGSGALASNVTAAVLPIGGVLGVMVCGFVSDKLFDARRPPVAILSLLAAAVVLLAGLYRLPNIWFTAGFLFCVGFFLYGPDAIISATAAIDFGTKRGAGTATGFVNGLGSIGGLAAGWLPGTITTHENWAPLFWLMLGGLAVSAVVLTPLWGASPSGARPSKRK